MRDIRGVMRWAWVVGLALGMVTARVRAGDTEAVVPVAVVNYSKLPVHATAVSLDEKEIDAKLGLAAGSPVSVVAVEGGAAIPIVRGMEEGRGVLRLYVSLAAASRRDLVVRKAERWATLDGVGASCELVKATDSKPVRLGDGEHVVAGEMTNGVVRLRTGKGGWDFGFVGSAAKTSNLLIQDGWLDFWVDNQDRGRIANSNPADLGLIHFAGSRIEKCEAGVSAEGCPSMRIVRRLGGFAKGMTVIETFELVPGMPILVCRVRWQNEGDVPLWIAYVGSGNGVAGRWSRDLMPGPLIERKKTSTQGELNGGETRPAWVGGLCRISMESPASGCGVGMSTLLPTPGKVGQGSMIWGCGGSGFQCNFIDPVQGQFPFLVKAHDGLDNGFVFLASQTGASVHRQTVELWKQTSAGKALRASPPCAVFVGGKAVNAQSIAETGDAAGMVKLMLGEGDVRRAALRLDLNRFLQCRVSVRTVGSQDAVEISARPMAGGKGAVMLLRAEKTGDYSVNLNEVLKWRDEVALVLEVKTVGSGELTGLSIGEALPVAPQPLSPPADVSITDIATMFRWKGIPMVMDYDLQWSQSADFAATKGVRLSDSRDFLWYLPSANNLPTPGKWYWRVRGVKGDVVGEWSAVRSFTVNDDHSTRPLKRPLTPRRPLFTMEASKVVDFTRFAPDIPEDIRPYVGIIAEGYVEKGLTIEQFAEGMERLPYSILVRSHPPTWVGLADLEWLCQHVSNFIGIQGGETLSLLYAEDRGKNNGDADYTRRMVQVLAKYGLMFQEADGTYRDDKWQELWDKQGAFIRKYGPWLVLTQKNNIIRRQFYSQSCAMGLWLGGITAGHGAWEDGGFYWQNAGFGEMGECFGERRGVLKDMPRIFWTLNFVMGVGRGCGIYSLDGQTLMVSPKEVERWPDQAPRARIWDTNGKTAEAFNRFVVPLIRGVVRQELIPSKEQVLGNVKLAVYNDKTVAGDGKAWPYYVEFGPLYAGTYGFGRMGMIDGQLWEFFPNTGRYFYVPVLAQGNEPLGGGVRNVPVSQLQSVAEVKKTFDAAYPAWYEGDALVSRIGETISVLNTHENEDVTESFAVPLAGGRFKVLSGKVGAQAYFLVKVQDQGRGLWLQSNSEYADRDAEVIIVCDRKPEWVIDPPSAGTEVRWDETTQSLRLKLSHKLGAVEVFLK